MYVEPNSTISVLYGVPLDNTYENTIYFSNALDQNAYFSSKIRYTFDRQTYQRTNRGYIRVNKPVDYLYGCNYLMFQNSVTTGTSPDRIHGSNKWFYAFITEVNYINENVTEIRYEIDDIQTWHFDYELEECFVEREHSATDEAGDNLVPEDLEIGEYVCETPVKTNRFNSWNIVVAATFDGSFANATGVAYAGIYSGLRYMWFPMDDTGVAQVNNFLLECATRGKSDGIVAIFLMPSAFCVEPDSGHNISVPRQYSVNVSKPSTLGMDGSGYYTPKNKKLLTYPYNFLYATNYSGEGVAYPYEYFSTSNCQLAVAGDFNGSPTFVLHPLYYKGLDDNWDEQISLGNVPQCAFTTDVFKEWLARTSARLPFDTISNATGLVAGIYRSKSIANALQTPKSSALVRAQYGTAVYGAISYVSGVLGQMAEHSIKPPHKHGNQTPNFNVAMKTFDFYLMQKHIRPEFAKIIDDFFTMYGYACHRVKVPNRTSRPYWNYCKTNGCAIKSVVSGLGPVGVPSDTASHICQIYDKGITWWKSGDYIGRYSDYDNSP